MKNNANYVEHSRTKRLSFNVETFIFISFCLFFIFYHLIYYENDLYVQNSILVEFNRLIHSVDTQGFCKFVDCAIGFFYMKVSSVFASMRSNVNITRVVKFFSFATVFLIFFIAVRCVLENHVL